MQFARLKPAQIKKDPKKVKKNHVKRQGSVPVQFSCNPCSEASLQVCLEKFAASQQVCLQEVLPED